MVEKKTQFRFNSNRFLIQRTVPSVWRVSFVSKFTNLRRMEKIGAESVKKESFPESQRVDVRSPFEEAAEPV